MSATEFLAKAILEIGGGWFQCWNIPTGWRIMLYRNEQIHTSATGATIDEAIIAALRTMGYELIQ